MKHHASGTSDERLLEVLYEICNYSDISGKAAYEAMYSRTELDFTLEECQEALYRVWEVMREDKHRRL